MTCIQECYREDIESHELFLEYMDIDPMHLVFVDRLKDLIGRVILCMKRHVLSAEHDAYHSFHFDFACACFFSIGVLKRVGSPKWTP